MLNVVIVGTGEMATSLLLGVREAGHNVVGFFRKEKALLPPFARMFRDLFMPTDFYLLAKKYKINEINAKSVNSEQFRKQIRKLKADIIIVGSWGEKFSKKTILTPKIATINVHPSLLPQYRGPNPYMMTISHGEKVSGVTFHFMDEHFDTGAVLMQQEVPIIDTDNGYTLKLRTVQIARGMLKELLPQIENGAINTIEQDENKATYFKRITHKDIYIDFSMGATEIYNKVRGFEPWASCYLKVKKEFLKIGHAQIVNLYENEFYIKNKTYKLPDRYLNVKEGKILARGKDWLLCSTCEEGNAILLYDLKLYGIVKQFLTKSFIKSLKSLK
ncbi:MAG: methionyl-tRNA formyltransferase [Candidatus Gastranaerophilales bacterium]|nr:methionyl-tRNA formyltransferase [Candidatus Gastranaerophilales bacterium]